MIIGADGKVVDLFQCSRCCNLDAVIAEYRCHPDIFLSLLRILIPTKLTQLLFLNELLCQLWYRPYNLTCNSNFDHFKDLPGSCLVVMALDTCNTSLFHDIEITITNLDIETFIAKCHLHDLQNQFKSSISMKTAAREHYVDFLLGTDLHHAPYTISISSTSITVPPAKM